MVGGEIWIRQIRTSYCGITRFSITTISYLSNAGLAFVVRKIGCQANQEVPYYPASAGTSGHHEVDNMAVKKLRHFHVLVWGIFCG